VRCGYCHRGVADGALVCPFCGFELAWAQQPPEPVRLSKTSAKGASPGLLWYCALGLLASAILSATVALGLLGAERGLEIRRQRSSQVGAEYHQRGLIHLEQGNYLLALAEFEEAVRLAPDHEDAREQLVLLQALLGVEATGPSGAPPEVLLSLYGEASALYARGAWSETITRLEELRSLDPAYRSQQVEQMLFDAYQAQGAALLEAGKLEESLSMLNKALELDPDDPEVAELQGWLSLYMEGLSHWDVDWDGVVDSLRELHGLNPTFLDVQQRLHDALLVVGDSFHEEGAWCVAESRYEEALGVMPSEEAQAKRDQARDLCLLAIAEATPSEVAPGAPALPLTTTVTPISSSDPGGFMGELVGRMEADATEMRIRVCVLDSEGVGVAGTGVEVSAEGWRSDSSTTETDGCCEFAGLMQQLDFTVELTDLRCVPFQVATIWGTEAQVNFVER